MNEWKFASFNYFQMIIFSVMPRKNKTYILLLVRKKQLGYHWKIDDMAWLVWDLNKTSEPGDLGDYLGFLVFLGIVLWTRSKLVLRVTDDLVSASSGVSPIQTEMRIAQTFLQYISPHWKLQTFPCEWKGVHIHSEAGSSSVIAQNSCCAAHLSHKLCVKNTRLQPWSKMPGLECWNSVPSHICSCWLQIQKDPLLSPLKIYWATEQQIPCRTGPEHLYFSFVHCANMGIVELNIAWDGGNTLLLWHWEAPLKKRKKLDSLTLFPSLGWCLKDQD